jgi:hypothetical protein
MKTAAKSGTEGKDLVIGFPSSYACCLIETLARHGGRGVVFLCPHGLVPAARIWSGQFGRRGGGVEILEGEPTTVDFGLAGEQWKRLAEDAGVVYHFYPPSNPREKVRKALAETLELAESAPRCPRAVFLSLFSAGLNRFGRDPGNDPGGAGSPWVRSAAAVEKILETRRPRLSWTVLRCAVPALVNPTFMPGKPTSILDAVLQVLILLHCQVDIKTFRKVEHRTMSFTPAGKLAETACALAEEEDAAGEVLNVFHDDGLDIASLRRIIDGVVSGKRIAGESFTTVCRRLGPKLLEQLLGDVPPLGLLIAATSHGAVPCERTRALLQRHGIAFPSIRNILPEAIEVSLKAVEESIRLLRSREESADSLEV